MSPRRITLSACEETAGQLKKAAEKRPLSAWAADVLEQHIEEAALQQAFEEFCAAHAPSAADKRKADAILTKLAKASEGTKRSCT